MAVDTSIFSDFYGDYERDWARRQGYGDVNQSQESLRAWADHIASGARPDFSAAARDMVGLTPEAATAQQRALTQPYTAQFAQPASGIGGFPTPQTPQTPQTQQNPLAALFGQNPMLMTLLPAIMRMSGGFGAGQQGSMAGAMQTPWAANRMFPTVPQIGTPQSV